MRTLFVTQLNSTTTEERLRSVFEKYGPVKRTNIIAYPWKKNCGFVEFEQESDCQDALVDMRFKDFPDKWQWKVCYAHMDDPGKSVQEEGIEEIDWLEELYGFPNHESQSYVSSLSVDTQGLQKQMDELMSFLSTPAPGVNRFFYTETYVLGLLARRSIKNLMEISGLSVREDAAGNIFGRWEGLRPELSALATGSHIYATPFFGEYNGFVGILGAIEAINVLKRSGFTPKRSVEVIMFTSNEPRCFGITCLGSLLLTRSRMVVRNLPDISGDSYLPDESQFAGYSHNDLPDISGDSYFPDESQFAGYSHNDTNITSYSSFVELHIEQGQGHALDGATSIGIVTDIFAPGRIRVEFQYVRRECDHGCAAALAAAEFALDIKYLEHISVELHTGAINSFPSKSYLFIDIGYYADQFNVNFILSSALFMAKKYGCILYEFKVLCPPAVQLAKSSIVHVMKSSSKDLNLNHKLMDIQAYNDSLFMSRISPVGMIFIPCYKEHSKDLDLTQKIEGFIQSLPKDSPPRPKAPLLSAGA